MASITIAQQVKVIKAATKMAAQSKESALQFLRDAGIEKSSNHKPVASSVTNTSIKK